MSQIKGLYTQQYENGEIHSVQVEDNTGTSWSLDPPDYIARGYKPAIDVLPNLNTFRRDIWLAAISEAYDGIETWAAVGYWDVHIETTPKRQIFLMETFVAKNVEGGGMTSSEMTKLLKSIPDSSWAKHADGSLQLVLN